MSDPSSSLQSPPIDLVEFLYRENWVTLSSIGSIFTFALVGSFRVSIFDKLMSMLLPEESFEYMTVKIDDDEIKFGGFVREAIIWIFMTMILYILATFFRYPDGGGITFNATH